LLEKNSKLGETYLTAYLLTKNARYANYQENLLGNTNFTPESYLNKIASEIEETEKRIKAVQNKEKASQALDNFADNSIKIMSEALKEKDGIIRELENKLSRF
jgi:hypothetical protein